MRTLIFITAVAALYLPAGGAAAQASDAQRGRALYENHCQACHTPKVHTRANKIPITLTELRKIVDSWQQEQRLRWSEQDVGDVTEYLNQTRYRYER